MRKILIVLTLLVALLGYSQKNSSQYTITYSYIPFTPDGFAPATSYYALVTNGKNSVWFKTKSQKQTETTLVDTYKASKVFEKNITKRQIISRDKTISDNDVLVKDDIKMEWVMSNQSQKIMGYNTKSATCKFKGRTYTAFFTTEIKVSDGPFKFMGLPGLILRVQEESNKYVWEAVAIQSNIAISLDTRVRSKSSILSWLDFEKKYRKDFKTYQDYESSKDPNFYKDEIKLYRSEIIIPEINS